MPSFVPVSSVPGSPSREAPRRRRGKKKRSRVKSSRSGSGEDIVSCSVPQAPRSEVQPVGGKKTLTDDSVVNLYRSVFRLRGDRSASDTLQIFMRELRDESDDSRRSLLMKVVRQEFILASKEERGPVPKPVSVPYLSLADCILSRHTAGLKKKPRHRPPVGVSGLCPGVSYVQQVPQRKAGAFYVFPTVFR